MSKILLVEDELSLAMLVKDNLEAQGYVVSHATDGQAAIEAFQRETPDLIILDVMMPKVNGYEVSKAIRTIDKKVPIIFLTAKVQVKDVVKGSIYYHSVKVKPWWSKYKIRVRQIGDHIFYRWEK